MEQLQPLIIVVVALIVLGLAWKIISGILRLILTVVVIGALLYFLLPLFAR